LRDASNQKDQGDRNDPEDEHEQRDRLVMVVLGVRSLCRRRESEHRLTGKLRHRDDWMISFARMGTISPLNELPGKPRTMYSTGPMLTATTSLVLGPQQLAGLAPHPSLGDAASDCLAQIG